MNDFILRRTNSLLSAHLPPKVTILWSKQCVNCQADNRESCLPPFWRHCSKALAQALDVGSSSCVHGQTSCLLLFQFKNI